MNKYIEKYQRLPIQMKASFWFLICSFLQKGISLITTPIFTRLLTTAEYGQFNVFSSWLGIIAVFVSLNLSAGVYKQGMIKYEERQNEYSSSLQALTLLLVFLWFIIYILFSDFWNSLFDLSTLQMISMLSMIWTTSVFSFWSAEQRIRMKYKALVIVTVLVSVIKPLLGIILVINSEDKVTARIVGIALVELMFYSFFFFHQLNQGRRFFDKTFWKHALSFNLPLIPHYLSMIVLNSSDRIMIKAMVGDSEAGIYSLAYTLSQIMIMFNTALLQTIDPWLYKKIKDRKVDDISKIAYPSFVIIAVVNIILIAFAPEIMKIIAPPEYYAAIWIIPPISMSVYFMYLYNFFAVFEFSFEKTKYIAVATILGAVLNVFFNYIFIDIFGYYAAGYTTLICYIIYALAHYVLMRRICKTHLENKQPYKLEIIIVITVCFMLLGFMFLLLYNHTAIRIGIIFSILFVLFVARDKIIAKVKELISLRGNT